jgi:hypothetical protein
MNTVLFHFTSSLLIQGHDNHVILALVAGASAEIGTGSVIASTGCTWLQSEIFLDQIEERDPYCNFLKLHLKKEHRKAAKRRVGVRDSGSGF